MWRSRTTGIGILCCDQIMLSSQQLNCFKLKSVTSNYYSVLQHPHYKSSEGGNVFTVLSSVLVQQCQTKIFAKRVNFLHSPYYSYIDNKVFQGAFRLTLFRVTIKLKIIILPTAILS